MITSKEIDEIRQSIKAAGDIDPRGIEPDHLIELAAATVRNVVLSFNPIVEVMTAIHLAMEVGYRIGRKQMLEELTKVKDEN